MPTFMTHRIFENFTRIYHYLVQGLDQVANGQPGPSSIFVPWAGPLLPERRGIYFIGIALAAERPPANYEPDFEISVRETAEFCDHRRHPLARTPFWRFLDRLTCNILGGPFEQTSDRWGWSNLLKIHWSEGSPSHWPCRLLKEQRDFCREALREEFGSLHESLIFVASCNEFGILRSVVGNEVDWNEEYQNGARFWWIQDIGTGNLFIHGPHPKYMQMRRLSDIFLKKTICLTQKYLDPF